MDLNSISTKKIITKYIFKDTISRVYLALRDFNQDYIRNTFGYICGPCQMIKGQTPYEINSEFNIEWTNYALLHMMCSEIEEKEHYKRIKWNINSEELNIKFEYTYEFHLNTIDKTTLLVWTVEFYNPDQNPITIKMINAFEVLRYDILKSFEKILEIYYDNLIQCESFSVNAKKEDIWRLITNWDKFREACPSIADKVECEGESNAIGGIIKLIYNKNIKSVCYLKVINIECDYNENIWNYELECYNGIPKVPKQILSFTLVRYEDETFFCFKHTFKEYVKNAHMESISKQKIEILNSLKLYFEDKKDISYN